MGLDIHILDSNKDDIGYLRKSWIFHSYIKSYYDELDLYQEVLDCFKISSAKLYRLRRICEKILRSKNMKGKKNFPRSINIGGDYKYFYLIKQELTQIVKQLKYLPKGEYYIFFNY